MASSTVAQYQDAVRHYDKQRAAASEKMKLIGNIHTAAHNDLYRFMSVNFGYPMPARDVGRSYGPTSRLPVDKWPDKEELKTVLENALKAFHHMHNVWADLSESDKAGLREPDSRFYFSS